MSIVFAAPGKYIQGRGELRRLREHISSLGKKALVNRRVLGVERIQSAMEGADCSACALHFVPFEGECSMAEIQRMQHIFAEEGCDIVVGAGGGKVLDTAKAAACFLKAPCVIVPTAVSSDAPCSALSVIYHDDGSLDRRLALPKSPDIVLIDSELIANAPAVCSLPAWAMRSRPTLKRAPATLRRRTIFTAANHPSPRRRLPAVL